MFVEDEVLVLLVVPDQEQCAVRNEEQESTDVGDDGAGAAVRDELHEGERVHGGVRQQIDVHGADHDLRSGRLDRDDDRERDREIQERDRDDEPPVHALEHDVLCVDEDEEDVGRPEEDAAQGEPVVTFGDEQHIAEPARDQRQQQMVFGPALPSGSSHIEQDEEDEQEGFRFLTGRSIVFPAVREVDAGEDEKQDEESVHGDRHKDPSFHIVKNLFEQHHCTTTEQIRSTVKKGDGLPKS